MNQEIYLRYQNLRNRVEELRVELRQRGDPEPTLQKEVNQLLDEQIKLEKQYPLLMENPENTVQLAREMGSNHPLTLYYRPGVIELRNNQQPAKAIQLFESFLRRTARETNTVLFRTERERAKAYLAECQRRLGNLERMRSLVEELLSNPDLDPQAEQIVEQCREQLSLPPFTGDSVSMVGHTEVVHVYKVVSTVEGEVTLGKQAVDYLRKHGPGEYGIFLDAIQEVCWIHGRPIQLTRQQFVLLFYFLRRDDPSSEGLAQQIYGDDDARTVNTLHRFISTLNNNLLSPNGFRLRSTGSRSGPGVYRLEPVTTRSCLLFDSQTEDKLTM